MEKINARAGEQIYLFLERMIEKAKTENIQFVAIHNDRHVPVAPDSHIQTLCKIWDRGGVTMFPEAEAVFNQLVQQCK